MANIWITSDTHFGHQKDFLWNPRGFDGSLKHDIEIIKRWNEVISPEDIVFHLGDVMLGDNEWGMDCFSRLNGNIYLALGNHDTNQREALYQTLPQVKDIQMCYRIKSGKWSFILSHYPTIVTNGDDHKKIINLCGHSHTTDPWLHWDIARAYHVELDAHDCIPINLETIKQEIIEHNNY